MCWPRPPLRSRSGCRWTPSGRDCARFTAGAEHNAGRLNVYLLGSTAVLLDLAHNEASLASLLEVAGALQLPGGELAVVLGTAGDRTDDAIHAMGAMAARPPTGWWSPTGSSTCAAANRARWRSSGGPAPPRPGWCTVDESVDELSGLIHLLDAGAPPLPDGSAVAVCALEQREEMVAEIVRRGGAEMTPAEVAERVAARTTELSARLDSPTVISLAASRSNCPCTASTWSATAIEAG